VYFKCKICGEKLKIKSYIGIGNHLRRHSATAEQYYLKYIGKLGICKCGKRTAFISIPEGYRKFCSLKCQANSEHTRNKTKETNLLRYGYEHSLQSKEIRDKGKVTCLKKYGSENYSTSKVGRKTLSSIYNKTEIKAKRTCLLRYGKEYYQQTEKARKHTSEVNSSKKFRKKVISTNLKKYGSNYWQTSEKGKKHLSELNKDENSVAIIKRKKKCLKKYGCEYSCQNAEVKRKITNSFEKHYGSKTYSSSKEGKNHLSKVMLSDKVQKKRIITSKERYGKDYYQQTQHARNNLSKVNKSKNHQDKVKKTYLKNWGVDHPMKNQNFCRKLFEKRRSHHIKINGKELSFLSNSEYIFAKKLKDTFVFDNEYFLNGHHFDFVIFKHGKLDTLVEIDGEFNHGINSDCDGKFVRGDNDYLRFSLVPKGVKFLVIDSKKLKEGFKELRRIYHMKYKEFIKDMTHSIPKSIPYYSFSKERMRKDYEHLCTYEYRNNANLGKSIILNYCRSLFNDIDWDERKELIKEHTIYYSPVSSHNPLDGLIEIKNISKLREKYRKKYKGNKIVKHKAYNPCKMLAICSLGKRYESNCKNRSEFKEAMKIVKLLKLDVKIKEV